MFLLFALGGTNVALIPSTSVTGEFSLFEG
jgi:hypothetical protein